MCIVMCRGCNTPRPKGHPSQEGIFLGTPEEIQIKDLNL